MSLISCEYMRAFTWYSSSLLARLCTQLSILLEYASVKWNMLCFLCFIQLSRIWLWMRNFFIRSFSLSARRKEMKKKSFLVSFRVCVSRVCAFSLWYDMYMHNSHIKKSKLFPLFPHSLTLGIGKWKNSNFCCNLYSSKLHTFFYCYPIFTRVSFSFFFSLHIFRFTSAATISTINFFSLFYFLYMSLGTHGNQRKWSERERLQNETWTSVEREELN